MFESLFTSQLAIHRHRTAPLRTEREQFLEHLRRQGSSHANLLQSASRLVYIVQFLNLKNLRPVNFDEIMDAGKVWVKKREPQRVHILNRCAVYGFTGLARRFLKFHGYLTEPPKPPQPFPDRLKKFLTFVQVQKGLRPETIRGYRWHVVQFLEWFATRHKKFSSLCLTDIDSYLLWQSKNWTAWTLKQAANTLRAFFHYGRTKNWCPSVFPEAIKGPCLRKDHAAPVG